MKDAVSGIVTVATMVVGVAIVAVLVSKNSQTAGVLSAGGSALANALRAATSPIASNSGITQLGQTGGVFTSMGQYLGE